MKKAEQAELNLQPQETAELERNYKDSVFVTVFHEKDKLIELYNAIFDTNYGMDTAIDIVTIKDVLFRTLKMTFPLYLTSVSSCSWSISQPSTVICRSGTFCTSRLY